MCWDAKTSLITFIIGTILNIYTYNNYNSQNIKNICIIWQWILCMQLAEFFIWNGLDNNNKCQNKFGTKLGLILNILQPLIVFIVPICFSDNTISTNNKILASILIIAYISFMLLKFNEVPEYTEITPSKKCCHLNLKWWDDITNSGLIYCITLFALIFLLLSPLKLAIFTASYIFIALIISLLFYSCGQPSMWCWFVVPMPLIVALFNEKFVKC
jgi:hypothetical protein